MRTSLIAIIIACSIGAAPSWSHRTASAAENQAKIEAPLSARQMASQKPSTQPADPPKPAGAPASTDGDNAEAPAIAKPEIPDYLKNHIRRRVNGGWTQAMAVGVVNEAGVDTFFYGKADIEKGGAVNDRTLFELGSVTKVFTTLALAEMVEEGKVSFDTPVQDLLPEGVTLATRKDRAIQLKDLANHTSSLPRLPGNIDLRNLDDPYAGYDDAQLFAFLNEFKPTWDIGRVYEYSNLGMGLLGELLARKDGKTYEAMIRDRICKPLGMNDTVIRLSDAQRRRLASGYAAGRGVPHWTFDALAGCGALHSTLHDMLIFIRAQAGIDKSPLFSAMMKTHEGRVFTPIRDTSVAMGWHVTQRKGPEFLWHNGGTGGFHCFCGFVPSTKTGVVVLANSADSIDDIGMHLLEKRHELRSIPLELATQPEALEAYVGWYELPGGIYFHVTRQGNQLYAQLSGQDKFPIYASGEDEFFYKAFEAKLTFQRENQAEKKGDAVDAKNPEAVKPGGDAKTPDRSEPAQPGEAGAGAHDEHHHSKIVSLTLFQMGIEQKATRKPDDFKPMERKAITVSADVLRHYVGKYMLSPQAVFDITLKGDQLYAQLTGQPPLPIFPESKAKFFYKAVNAQIEFKVNADGDATSLTLFQMGLSLPARRIREELATGDAPTGKADASDENAAGSGVPASRH